jgi:class 3 adenylate cyclase
MSLRTRLFLNVGVIFFFVALLSFLLPSIIVNKEMAKGGEEIETFVQKQERNVNKILASLLADIFREFKGPEDQVAVTAFLQQMARTSQKTIIFLYHNQTPFAFNNEGKPFDPKLEGFDVSQLNEDMGKVTWRGTTYNYLKYIIDGGWDIPRAVKNCEFGPTRKLSRFNCFSEGSIELIQPSEKQLNPEALARSKSTIFDGAGYSTLVILNPSDQEFSVIPLLKKMGNSISHEITTNILLVSLLIFAIALFVLSRTAKKITDPVVALAQATGEIEKGHYDLVSLPTLGKRKDEIGTLSHGFEKMITALMDREKIRGVLSKVVSKEIAAEILQSNIELGGEERVVTVLFSDVRDFTKITEKMDPKNVVQMMNSYFSQMCRIIDHNEGVVDKFVGDLIMVLYGAPIEKPDSAKRAIATALLMKKQSVLPIGIGIHTGIVVTGNIGSETRLNYTVLGANVNLASRLCSAAKPMQILISEATLRVPGVMESFDYQELPSISLKGFEQPVKVYEILDNKKNI